MAPVMNRIPLYYETFEVGCITVDADGAKLTYDRRWLEADRPFPISLTMPLADTEYESAALVPWLANLLPEAAALKVVGRKLGISPDDVIGLLQHIGQDTAGALSIGAHRAGANPGYMPIADGAALEKIINELPSKPFLVGEDGVSMSLSGVQEKIPLAMTNGRLAVPVNGAPSTHILKPDDHKRLFGSVHNEALCLVLARRCNLRAAEVTTGRAGDRCYLLVTRYDRLQTGRNQQVRIHQEDFCQALGKPPSAKYEHNQTGIRGPRLSDMFQLVNRHMTAADTLGLLDAVIFNVLICNTDAHAKNYSIILTGEGARLAPLYDLMCAACWEVTQNMAQSIAEKRRGAYLCGRHWQRMAVDCGLNPTSILKRVGGLASQVLKHLDGAAAEVAAMPAGEHPMLGDFVAAIRARCRAIAGNLSVCEGQADEEEAPTLDA